MPGSGKSFGRVHPLVTTFQFPGVFSVVLEDGPIRVHFHRRYGFGQNVLMNGCTAFGTSSRIEVGQSDHYFRQRAAELDCSSSSDFMDSFGSAETTAIVSKVNVCPG